jgi:hypothetical protein
MEPARIASAEARQRHEALIRAEAAAERTREIHEKLKERIVVLVGLGLSERGEKAMRVALAIIKNEFEAAFPKPGSAEAAASPIVTAPSSSAPIPPGGYRPEECPCCFSEDTPEGADCFCPDWCPEQCEGGEVHR